MRAVLNQVTAHPLGKALLGVVSPAIRLARRVAHPDLPQDRRLMTAAFRDRTFTFTLRRWSPCDTESVQQCFIEGQYEPPPGPHAVFIDRIYQDLVASGRQPLIIDCGANIGASVAWFSIRYPEAHILAIEPAPGNFDLLQRNCGHLDTDLRQAAISDEDGHAFLLDPGPGVEMGFQVGASYDGPRVTTVSLATLLASKPDTTYVPFLLKVDIEGGEQSLFRSDPAILNLFPVIIMEPHDWLHPGQHPSREFFRFHAASNREFYLKHENVASVAVPPHLLAS